MVALDDPPASPAADRTDAVVAAGLAAVAALAPFAFLPWLYEAANRPQAAFGSVGALGLLALWSWRGRPVRWHGVFDPPLAGLLAWATLSLAWSTNRALAVEVLLLWWTLAAAYFAASQVPWTDRTLRLLFGAIATAGAVVSTIGLAQALGGLAILPQAEPPAATFLNRNVAAEFIVLAVPLAIVIAAIEGRAWVWAWAAATALMAAFVYVTMSRSAWLAVAVQAAFLAATLPRALARNRPWRSIHPTAMAAALCVGLGLAWLARPREVGASLNQAAARVAGVFSPDASGPKAQSARTRLVVWRNALAILRDHPLLGVGIGNLAVEYPRYARTAVVDPNFSARRHLDYAHNDAIQVGAELGFVGLGLVVWLGAASLRSVGAAVRRSGPRQPFAVGAASACLGLGTTACFGFPFERAVSSLVFGVLLGVGVALSGRETPASESRTEAPKPMRIALAAVLVLATLAVGAWQIRRLEGDAAVRRMAEAESRGEVATILAEGPRALALEPTRAEALFFFGQGLLASGQWSEAVTVFETFVRSQPNHVSTLANLGVAHTALGAFDRALLCYERALAILPDEVEIVARRAALLERVGRLDEAREAFVGASRLDATSAAYPYRAGILALRSARFDESAALLSRAVALDPKNADAEKGLGLALGEIPARRAEALGHLRRALELDPTGPDAPRLRMLVEQGRRSPTR